MTESIPTPELDAMKEVHADSQVIGEFLEWAGSKGLFLAEHVQYEGYRDQTLVVSSRQPEEILAEFYEIDLTKVEQERRTILDALRSL